MGQRLADSLKSTRQKMGFASARSFYQELANKADLEFNYSYYMKIEAAQLNPSEKIVQQIVQLLPQKDGDQIIKSYCEDLFPDRMARILSLKSDTNTSDSASAPKSKKTASQNKNPRSYQQEISPRQVATLSKSQDIYFAFLILTLSRWGLKQSDFTPYPFADLETTLHELIAVKLIYFENDTYYPVSPEFKFPANSDSLRPHYQKLDTYDTQKATFFKLEKLKRASFFKRISPKYIDLLSMNLELIFQLLRTADETDVHYNTEVISFDLQTFKGQLKG